MISTVPRSSAGCARPSWTRPVVYRRRSTSSIPTSVTTDVWRVPVDLEVGREACWHLVHANAVDAATGPAGVALAHAARAIGAVPVRHR